MRPASAARFFHPRFPRCPDSGQWLQALTPRVVLVPRLSSGTLGPCE